MVLGQIGQVYIDLSKTLQAGLMWRQRRWWLSFIISTLSTKSFTDRPSLLLAKLHLFIFQPESIMIPNQPLSNVYHIFHPLVLIVFHGLNEQAERHEEGQHQSKWKPCCARETRFDILQIEETSEVWTGVNREVSCVSRSLFWRTSDV